MALQILQAMQWTKSKGCFRRINQQISQQTNQLRMATKEKPMRPLIAKVRGALQRVRQMQLEIAVRALMERSDVIFVGKKLRASLVIQTPPRSITKHHGKMAARPRTKTWIILAVRAIGRKVHKMKMSSETKKVIDRDEGV